jgi:hypothetical protein
MNTNKYIHKLLGPATIVFLLSSASQGMQQYINKLEDIGQKTCGYVSETWPFSSFCEYLVKIAKELDETDCYKFDRFSNNAHSFGSISHLSVHDRFLFITLTSVLLMIQCENIATDCSKAHELSESNRLHYPLNSNIPEEANILVYAHPYVSGDITEAEHFLERASNIDNRFYAPIDFTPQCVSSQLSKEVNEVFIETAAFIVKSHKEATNKGRKLGVIWFEKHNSCSCLEQEKQLFKLLASLGINDLYMEGTENGIIESEETIQRIQRESFSKQTYLSPGLKWILPRYVAAKMTVLNIIHAEQPVTDRDDEWLSDLYIEKLKKLGTISCKVREQQSYDSLKKLGETLDLYDLVQTTKLSDLLSYCTCPTFDARDQEMIKTIENAPESFGAIFGAMHFGALYERLKGRVSRNFEYVYISCAPRQPIRSTLESRFSELENIFENAGLHECAENLLDIKEKYTLSFRLLPPDLKRSLTNFDIEF